MVKSIITIIISLLILTGGAIFEQTYILNEFKEFSIATLSLKEKAELETATTEETVKLQQDWENKKRILHAFIPHSEIKEIGLWLSEAVEFSEYQNYEELADKLKVIYDLSLQIPQSFRVKFENIF